jgi:pimeloyl-ACP methyl ester carboxylesterase
MQNTIQCEELASRGYIVVAMDHAFDAHATFFKNNILADFRSGIEGQISEEEFWSIRTPQLNTRAADISFVIDQISTLKESSSNSFFKAIRTDKVGIFGHSFGGATAIMASLLDSRIKACINLDGWIVPIPEKVIETGIDKPFLYIGQEAWNDTLNYIKLEKFIKNSNSSNRVLKLKGTKHYDFTDIPQIAPIASKIGITGSMNTLELKHLINKEVVDFFDSLIY